jgi:SAM-dependent methyltransferase
LRTVARTLSLDDRQAEDVARFFDREACRGSSRHRAAEGRLHGVSRVLLEMLEDADVSGRPVLDAGCGQGALTMALGQRGVTAVTGIDLSPESVAAAERAAAQTGVSARFLVAKAGTDHIEPHDVVVSHTVRCCYFDAGVLLGNTSTVARSLGALSLPHSRGRRGALVRLLGGAENAWRGLRGDPFRALLHDETLVTRTLHRQWFSVRAQRNHWTWPRPLYDG